MKYLLGFLENLSDGPNLSDPEFQQLLVDVQAGKTQSKSSDAFFESLEKIVNELKSTPESLAFQKPVTRRDAPDYYEVIKKPMDLSTILRQVKQHKYKNKAEFAADLNLIWENCATYNHENHPIRLQARFMKQKADHHLDFLADKTDTTASQPLLSLPPAAVANGETSSASRRIASSGAHAPPRPSPLRESSQAPAGTRAASTAAGAEAGEEDAQGEAEDESLPVTTVTGGEGGGQSFRDEAGAGPRGSTAASQTQVQERQAGQEEASRGSRSGDSFATTSGRQVAGIQANGIGRSPAAYWPKLQTTLDSAPALTRTSNSMSIFSPFSLSQPGAGPSGTTSCSDKGKARDNLAHSAPPSWYSAAVPTTVDQRPSPKDLKERPKSKSREVSIVPGLKPEEISEGSWWGAMTKDEAFTGGVPSIPSMSAPSAPRVQRIGKRKRRKSSDQDGDDERSALLNGTLINGYTPSSRTPSLELPRPVNLGSVVHRNVDNLCDARQAMNQIQEWQRIEMEGGVLPRVKPYNEKEEKAKKRAERLERKQRDKEERLSARKRARLGGEIGEEEAAISMRRATAGLLAHSGFEGANEIALNMMTRLAIEHVRNLGRTTRLFLDGMSHDMPPDQMVLHVLHENGQIQLQDLEAHIKDDIEKEGMKIAEMTRKVKQAYRDVTVAPVIRDDMMFADDGEMLLDGNFADELGEDFLGLREMGIDKEFGLSSLTVPSNLFYGRRKRAVNAGQYGSNESDFDYPPPPPFIPLNPSTISTQLPGLLHAFYASRLENGLGVSDDDPFDQVHSQIGSLGQIVVKNPPSMMKKKAAPRDENGEKEKKSEVKKAKPKKEPKIGVGKGNWIRPSKEERERRAAEKRAALERERQLQAEEDEDAAGEDDAEGEEE